jgi:hypothetical protein
VDPFAHDVEADAAIQAQCIRVLGLDAEADDSRALVAQAPACLDEDCPSETESPRPVGDTELRHPPDIARERSGRAHIRVSGPLPSSPRATTTRFESNHGPARIELRHSSIGRAVWPGTSVQNE